MAVGVGGGHYAPHFADLAIERSWAFGHLLSRHALDAITGAVARQAWEGSPGAVGWLFARVADFERGPWSEIAPRVRENEAPRRGAGPVGAPAD